MVRVQFPSLVLVIAMAVAASSYGQTKPAAAADQDIVSASTLKRTHTVPPAWPEGVVGVEGWVQLRFTLLPNGTITDIEVNESHPAGVFDASAVTALQQWKYEPVERDGKKVAQRAEIRMKYALPR